MPSPQRPQPPTPTHRPPTGRKAPWAGRLPDTPGATSAVITEDNTPYVRLTLLVVESGKGTQPSLRPVNIRLTPDDARRYALTVFADANHADRTDRDLRATHPDLTHAPRPTNHWTPHNTRTDRRQRAAQLARITLDGYTTLLNASGEVADRDPALRDAIAQLAAAAQRVNQLSTGQPHPSDTDPAPRIPTPHTFGTLTLHGHPTEVEALPATPTHLRFRDTHTNTITDLPRTLHDIAHYTPHHGTDWEPA